MGHITCTISVFTFYKVSDQSFTLPVFSTPDTLNTWGLRHKILEFDVGVRIAARRARAEGS